MTDASKPRRRPPRLPVGACLHEPARPERPTPANGDPGLVDSVADRCAGGCPRARRDVVAYLCVDVYQSHSNDAMARELSLTKGSCCTARQRGRAAVLAHRRALARSLVGKVRADRADLASRADAA